ncbi:TetR family transcriptional regulator [Nocardioides sp. Kera G14]|uniref:TetR family transcriptional regulator n=1 Tax=Nocardioides sp. Kera G14 TaxID=2884264 RepID=UPI001D1156DA|nr:TetR family transcriptional regulator [Nocardioides sp. Kera G14]UDY22296.1 TetR family transcriptional regulator [Nocardioides sp. Kera G14]
MTTTEAVTTVADAERAKAGSPAQRERRKRILDATIDLASEGGFDAVQMREVAERAEVALGTLYRYFPSKIHLLVAALGREFEGTEARTSTRVTPGDTAHERVMYILSRMTKSMQRQPQLTEAMVRAFMFADSSVTDEIHLVGMQLTAVISRAMAGSPDHSDATAEEAAIIRVISDVWLSALVSWVTGRMAAKEVENHLDTAVKLILP